MYWPRANRWLKLRISTKAMRTIEKIGLEPAAQKAGVDLWQVPFQMGESEERQRWKEANPAIRNSKKQPRQMKNLVKLAESDHPLAIEAKQFLEKVRPMIKAGDFPEELLHLGKLAASEHALAGEGRALLDRFRKEGQHLAEAHRLEKLQEQYGLLAPSRVMLEVDEQAKLKELESLSLSEAD